MYYTKYYFVNCYTKEIKKGLTADCAGQIYDRMIMLYYQ